MARSGGGNRGCRHVNWLMYYGQPAAGPTLGYGLLYNWYAATDVRGIAPDGWRVPTLADFTTLNSATGANTTERGAALKGTRILSVDGHPGWGDISNATNSSGFNGYCYGTRLDDGSYQIISAMSRIGMFQQTTESSPTTFTGRLIADLEFSTASFTDKATGASVRCVRDTEPPAAIVTDIDDNIYSWVQIGTQYWLAQNLKTTKYNNGDSIATGLDDAAWAATTDGAWAYPNGDQNLPI